MKRLFGLLGQAFVYFCVATVIAAAVAAAMLYQKGAFHDDRMLQMWAALHGISLALAEGVAADKPDINSEQPSYDEILTRRTLAALDIDLRENTLDKSLGELRAIETKIQTERFRFDNLVKSFDRKLKDLEANATDAAVLETQQTLEALPPKQAKEQLLKLLAEAPSPGIENPMSATVSLIKAMPIERRRKILAEFKNEDESAKLGEILKEILRGAPDVPTLRQARDELQKVNSDPK